MKRLLALALACLVALPVAGCGGEEDFVSSESASYDVELPEGWVEASDAEKEQAARQVGAVVDEATDGQGIDGVAVTSLWADGDLADPEAPNLIVIREPLPDDVATDRFVDISISNVRSLFAEALEGDLEETESVEIAGEAARAFDYEVDLGGSILAKRVVFAFRDDLAYTLTLSSLPEDADSAIADLDEIGSSWQWAD